MIKLAKFYAAISLVLIITLASSVMPPQVWHILGQQAAIARAEAAPANPLTKLLGPQRVAMFNYLQPELSDQFDGLDLFTESSEPKGVLMDVNAFQTSTQLQTLQQPQTLQNPLTLSRVQSAYSAEAALNNTVVVTFTVTNNQPPISIPEIDLEATVTETLELIANLDTANDPNTIRNILLTDELLPSLTTLLDLSQDADQQNNNFAWNLGDLPPLSTLTVSLTLQIPSSILDFIELDTGAEVWGTLKKGVTK